MSLSPSSEARSALLWTNGKLVGGKNTPSNTRPITQDCSHGLTPVWTLMCQTMNWSKPSAPSSLMSLAATKSHHHGASVTRHGNCCCFALRRSSPRCQPLLTSSKQTRPMPMARSKAQRSRSWPVVSSLWPMPSTPTQASHTNGTVAANPWTWSAASWSRSMSSRPKRLWLGVRCCCHCTANWLSADPSPQTRTALWLTAYPMSARRPMTRSWPCRLLALCPTPTCHLMIGCASCTPLKAL